MAKDKCGLDWDRARNWGGGVWSTNSYPSSSRESGDARGGGSSESKSNGPSGYTSNSGKQCGTYTEKYATDLSYALVKMHGSKPSLVLGFNPSILAHQKDTDGVSKQTKGLINDLNYQLKVSGFKDPKGIVLAHCDQTNVDMGVLVQTLQPFAFNLTIIDFSNNRLGDAAVEDLFYTMGAHQTPAKYVQIINLSNNFIGDYGAEYIAQSLISGRYPATRHIDISGNNITSDGNQHLMTALESPKVKSIMIALVKNIVDLNQTVDKAIKSTVDFVNKALKYAVDQHNQGLKGTKWDGSTVRTDNLDKWKNCKDTGSNVGMGFMAGLVKCLPLAETGPGMFICASKDASTALLDPDTLWCAVEINEFVEEKSSELIGDCVIC